MPLFWNNEKIFFDGDEYFDSLIKDIDQARDYITVEIYIFNDDMLGKKITSHLINAHQRGVKIQIVVDGIGSYSFFNKLHGIFQKKGIIVKMYNPLPFFHPYYGKLSLLKKIQVFAARIWRINRRNHRKIITIDHDIMYAGSFNFTVEHTMDHLEKAWKDMGVRVTGEHVKFAVLNFKKIWKLREFYRYRKQIRGHKNFNWKLSPLRLNHTLYMKRYYYRDFLQNIHRAKEKIWLMTPYFIPKRRMIRALGKAAQNGVDVRVIISLKTDVKFFRWLQYFYYEYLLKKGVKVYQYTDSILHAKNYIIDDFITVGSTNLNHRSFMHDLEVDLVIQNEDNKKKIEEHFLTATMTQKTITLEGLRQRPLLDRILSQFRKHDTLKYFDKCFIESKDKNLIQKMGFKKNQQELLLKNHSHLVTKFRKTFSYFERAKSKRGLYKVADGINRDAIFCMRDLMREYPQLYLTRQNALSFQDFIEVAKSSYARKSDLRLTEIRKKQINRFQNTYMALVSVVENVTSVLRTQLLLELTMRSSVINKYDRVTGDSITYIVQKVQKLRPKLSAEELFQLAQQFSTYQNLDPDQKKVTNEIPPRHKNIMQNLYSIVRECREGL